MAAVTAALAGAPGAADPTSTRAARADSTAGCSSRSPAADPGHGYATCGEGWAIDRLPVRIHVNQYGVHDGVSNHDVISAAKMAALSWDLAAPFSGRGPRGFGCADARIICTITDGNATVNGRDGISVLVWAPLGPLGDIGRAIVNGRDGFITDVDVILNSDLRWSNEQASATGEASGALGGLCPVAVFCPYVFDLQSIITHELGHVLGLDDLNPGGASCWSSDLSDLADYTQTMYACTFPGSTNKRTLEAGDIAGLTRVMTRAQTGT